MLCDWFKHRQQVFHRGDLFVRKQDQCILKHSFHLVGISDKIGRNITTVKLHPFNNIHMRFSAFCLFNSNNAFLFYLAHGFGNKFANAVIIVG